MRLYFCIRPNTHIFLYFGKGPYKGKLSNLAPVHVYRMHNGTTLTESDVIFDL